MSKHIYYRRIISSFITVHAFLIIIGDILSMSTNVLPVEKIAFSTLCYVYVCQFGVKALVFSKKLFETVELQLNLGDRSFARSSFGLNVSYLF